MILVVDNGSIYTAQLTNFLSEQKTEFEICDVGKTSINDWSASFTEKYLTRFGSFILTGRKENNRVMNKVNTEIIKHAISQKKQLLGICYGAEILNTSQSGTIKRHSERVYGDEVVNVEKQNKICKNEISVFESHRWEISQLGKDLHCLASSKSCKYEVIKHNEYDIFGTQFHPEMTKDGQSLIESFLNIID
tara:strand:- start:189 stop:764 length:576 start_codon:yes stop_codon:yes gene_type:complete